MSFRRGTIAVVGEGILVPSIILCLLRAGHAVRHFGNTISPDTLCKDSGPEEISLEGYQGSIKEGDVSSMATCQLVVLHTPENPHSKRAWLEKVFRSAPSQALVLTNSESIPLAELQADVPDPSRLLGLNWVYPAHRTLFAELLSTAQNREEEVQAVFELIASDWGKDPYRLRQGRGIRSRLMAAMAREAFYLIENGYVEIADIDRACRNDPGYYLPFAGNCRYMDLMGTYIYGLVMKDLNPELSNAKEVPEFFDRFVASGRLGWKSGEGCYRYRSDEILRLREVFRKFSGEMAALMQRYPFPEGRFPVQPDASSGYHEKKYHARPWVEKNTKK